MDAVDAVLARMRADQGVASDDDASVGVRRRRGGRGVAAPRSRASTPRCARSRATFRERTEDALGRRWYAHFEAVVVRATRRDARRRGDPERAATTTRATAGWRGRWRGRDGRRGRSSDDDGGGWREAAAKGEGERERERGRRDGRREEESRARATV